MDQSNGHGPGSDHPGPGNEPRVAHELRYDGPITLDEEGFEDEARNPGTARRTVVAFFAVSFVVVVLLAVALFLKEDNGARDVTTLVAAEPAGEPAGSEPYAGEGAPEQAIAGLAAGTSPQGAPAEDPAAWRAVPSENEPEIERPAPVAAAPVDAGAPQDRPAPDQAAHYVEPAPAPKSPSPPVRPAEIARAGDLAEAARRSRRLALAAPSGSWTLQVLFACEPANVRRAIDNAGGEELMIFAVSRGGRDCYRLSWGIYGSREAAVAAAGGVPGYFREANRPQPVVLAKAAGL